MKSALITTVILIIGSHCKYVCLRMKVLSQPFKVTAVEIQLTEYFVIINILLRKKREEGKMMSCKKL